MKGLKIQNYIVIRNIDLILTLKILYLLIFNFFIIFITNDSENKALGFEIF